MHLRKRSAPLCTALFLLLAAAFGAMTFGARAETGPTLLFDYGKGEALDNSVAKFMYFVPLVSPEPVSSFTNAGNTQRARINSPHTKISGKTFVTKCEFEFVGTGFQRNVFDHTDLIHDNEKSLKAGHPIARQISGINVEGTGSGLLEVEGTITNGTRKVQVVRMYFNRDGKTSPVSIRLQDIVFRKGRIWYENELVARVNALAFRKIDGAPKMEVTLASVKSGDAGDNTWQNLIGDIKGAAANLLLSPLDVSADGHQAMLDFGLTLATAQRTFTFPFATRLKESGRLH